MSYDQTQCPEEHKSVIVQRESLHKLETARQYDLVIIDKVKSFLNQAAST